MAKLHLVQEYHIRSGTPQIGILQRGRLQHSSGIHGEASPLAAGYVFAYDLANASSSCTTEICNPVQNDVLGYL